MRAPAVLTAAFCLVAVPAFAQVETATGLDLTPQQKRAVYDTLSKQRVKSRPAKFDVGVGGHVPRSVALYGVPRRAGTASLQRYRYTLAGDRVVLVEPKTRTVVLILGIGF